MNNDDVGDFNAKSVEFICNADVFYASRLSRVIWENYFKGGSVGRVLGGFSGYSLTF